jgi:two-component system cell cycle response regulator
MSSFPASRRRIGRDLTRGAGRRVLGVAAFGAIGAGLLFELLRLLVDLGGPGAESLAENWVYMAVELLAVSLCAARTALRPAHRRSWALITGGLAAWAVGDLLWAVWLDQLSHPPFPSPADASYLLMYPAIYAGLMLRVRSRMRDAAAAQWLDGAVLLLAVGAIAAALVTATSVATGHQFVAEAVTTAYPVLDCILLMLLLVAYTLADWRPERDLLMLGVGIVLVSVADILFTEQVAGGMYIDDTLLNLLYLSSFSSFAAAAWMPSRGGGARRHSAPHTIGLTLAAAAAALALLILAAFVPVAPTVVALAAGALVLAAVRSALTYAENVRFLRSRAHEAMHDALTGLPNRRRLIADLEDPAAGDAPRTLGFFDLNGFKRYNDGFGHLAGDALLTRLAAALEAAITGTGRAYRLGGDEFCILLDGHCPREHRVIARALTALSESSPGFVVSAAAGVAILPEEAGSASAALRLADERMYADKGRVHRSQTRDVLMQLLSERAPGLLDHVSGVTELAAAVADVLCLDAEQADETLRAAELHDIGKLAIPDEILDKRGPLDEREWAFMRQHPEIGERILGAAPALAPVAKLVRASHERWDGGGYPDGLAGERVPLGARIVAACDAYDAIISDRCYQHARTPEQALAELRRHSGTQFDPAVVDAVERCVRAGAHAEPPLAAGPAEPAPADAPGGRADYSVANDTSPPSS